MYKNPSKTFKSLSLQLISAILTEVPEAVFLRFEDDSDQHNKKFFVISYPESQQYEVDKLVKGFEDKALFVNLFYYNRNLNFLRDRLFNKKTER